MRRALRVATAVAIGWVAFAFRFQRPDFLNDHFEHLSMARQVLFGELPYRDFFDAGRPLTVLLSAAVQGMFGHSLFGEALLTIGALAVGAAIIFWLASEVSRSIGAGVLAALIVVVMSPRLYSYPKVIVFAVALLAVWKFVDRPSAYRAAWLGAVTVFALLMRHDFGVYVGVLSVATMLMVRLKADTTIGWRPIAAYFLAAALLAAPYLFFLQQQGMLLYTATSGARSLAGAARLTFRPLHFDLSHGVVHLDPVRARIGVRWTAATTPDQRLRLEERYGLVQAQDEGGSSKSYGITDASRDNIRALVADEHVDDTDGIHRGAAMLDQPVVARWLSRVGLSRLVIGPFFSAEDAEQWLYLLFWLIPLAALVVVVVRATHGGLTPDSIKVAVASLLGVIFNVVLLRGSLDSRLPDVVVPPAIVLAWLLAEGARRVRPAAPVWRVGAAVLAVSACAVFGSAASAYTGVAMWPLAAASVDMRHVLEVARALRVRPMDTWAGADSVGVRRIARYVHECTAPDDRLLLVAYEPQVFYYAERLFAGGMEHFHARRYSSPAEQAKTVARLKRQRVPLVIVENDRARMLQDDYVQVSDYVQARFRPVAEMTFGTARLWRVYADPAFPVRRKWDDLPCFAG